MRASRSPRGPGRARTRGRRSRARSSSSAATSSAPDPDEPGQFAWARAGTIEERLDTAGFGEHEVDTVDFVLLFPSFDAWIAAQRDLASRFRAALDGLDADERDDVFASVREQALPYVQQDGSVVLPARTWVAAASA